MTDPDRSANDALTTPVGVRTNCPQCGTSMPAFETRCSACGAHRTLGSPEEQRENLLRRMQAGIGTAYELLEMIGKGGMGVVFRARERALDREVALKVLAFDPMLVPDAFARFEREARLAARLDHPHIVPIFAVGQGSGVAFYTMRLVRGGSLDALIGRGVGVETARAIRFLREIAAALDHAHAQGVVHRDIKPANVMLGDGDHVFVADFGIARAVGGDGTALTTSGVVGSPAYMAPEQWQGAAVDGRADQYALGILAYELLSGTRPYGDAPMHELLRVHLTEELPDITAAVPGATHAMRDVLRRATAKEPAERFESATAFVAALDAATGSTAVPATVAKPSAPTRAPQAPAAVRPAPLPARRRASRILPVSLALAAIAIVALELSRRNAAAPPAPSVSSRPETVVVSAPTAPPETIRVAAPNTPPETVRVPLQPPGRPVPGGAGGRVGTLVVNAWGRARGTVVIDGTARPNVAMPLRVQLPAGRHVVALRGAVASFPESLVVNVLPGDTVRTLFVPAVGGGARGDSLRAQAAERLRRAAQRGRRGGGVP
jgi:serine/threonine protein kinase